MTAGLKSSKHLAAVFLLAGLASNCERGPRLPEELTFEGRRLERSTDWSMGGISGVVFTPPGEPLATASLQLGILVSREHASSVDLHEWVMQQYRSAPFPHWYESSTSDEACKVGLMDGPRPFVALHVCRSGGGMSGCAEADERLADEIVGRCLNKSTDCWDELCHQMWTSKRALLEAELDAVLESQ